MASSDPSPALVEARDLRREFPAPGAPLVALDGASFSLARGGSLAIMGPSGSGKSTLLQILGALDRPTSGRAVVDGVDPFALGPKERAQFRCRKIGFVFQDHHLLPQCSALENALLPAFARGDAGPADEERARRLLEKVGLAGRLEHRPAEMSGGERQRVAVARAMMNGPPLLLCDEPTGNLDRKSAEAVGEIFRALQAEEGASLIVVTHSAAFAERFDRRMRLEDGKLAEE